MPPARFAIHQCCRPACRLRFPAALQARPAEQCPRCGAAAPIVAEVSALGGPLLPLPPPVPPLELLLDNLRSVYNVGSIFRSADGAGVRALHLCGITPTPDHPRLAKTALQAESAVAWRYYPNSLDAADALRQQGYRLWALERHPRAESLYHLAPTAPAPPLVLIIGGELAGVDPALLACCERVVALPMAGVKESLNVATAAGIAMYHLRFGLTG